MFNEQLHKLNSDIYEVRCMTQIVYEAYNGALICNNKCPDIAVILKIILERFETIEDNFDKLIYEYLQNQ